MEVVFCLIQLWLLAQPFPEDQFDPSPQRLNGVKFTRLGRKNQNFKVFLQFRFKLHVASMLVDYKHWLSLSSSSSLLSNANQVVHVHAHILTVTALVISKTWLCKSDCSIQSD